MRAVATEDVVLPGGVPVEHSVDVAWEGCRVVADDVGVPGPSAAVPERRSGTSDTLRPVVGG